MQKIYFLFTLFALCHISVFATTRGDAKILEATENIRYASQKIVKNYFFSYAYPERIDMKKVLEEELNFLSQNFRTIAVTSKDSDTKDILEFLSYNREQIFELFNEERNIENASLMLDYSETLLEGINSIAQGYQYNFSKEENMLILTKNIEYLLERTLKYYMVMHTGLDNSNMKEMMQKSISDIEESLITIQKYSYSPKLLVVRKKLLFAWQKSKILIDKPKKLFIPILLFSSIKYIETLIHTLAVHHSKNQ
jgi:hypothetical protein